MNDFANRHSTVTTKNANVHKVSESQNTTTDYHMLVVPLNRGNNDIAAFCLHGA